MASLEEHWRRQPRLLRLEARRRTKATFKQYGVYYAAEMKAFFESVLY